ncbi:MAG: hypothetical protein JXL84_17495 [Deltaproteobacteria bacterium]|nr:hypothetical protein [Deltaproteobacteria bacterium]
MLLFLLSACQTPRGVSGNTTGDLYYQKIREWQNRIQREGWTVGRLDDVLGEALGFVIYRLEIDDHWDTPHEFIHRGFQGDCEDIAVFMMGTLRYLRYPHRVRVLAVQGVFTGHALLKVEMPDGLWRIYETSGPALRGVNPNRLRVLVEFDEREILYPEHSEQNAKAMLASNPYP